MCDEMTRLTALMAEATELSPVEVLDSYRQGPAEVSETEFGTPYAVSDDPNARLMVNEYPSATSTEIEDDLASAIGVSAEFPDDYWDIAVYSAQNWRGPGSVDCANATESELADLVFFGTNGADLWTPGEEVAYLVLDTDEQFLIRVAEIDSQRLGRKIFSAVLLRPIGEGRLFRYEVVHLENIETPLQMVMGTLQLQGL